MPFLKSKKLLVSRSTYLENLAKKNGLRRAIFNQFHDRYIGDWKNDAKDGKGALLTRTGVLYEGDWERGYRHGFGVLAHKGDNGILELDYRGEWRNGKKYGAGEQHYPDGGFYRGEMKNSKRHGHGQMWYGDKSFFHGGWKNDRRVGLGLFVCANGNRYEGTWSDDCKHGKGRYYHLDSGQMQEGVWHQDVCVFSTIEDIPFLQSAVTPTPYPVPYITLRKVDAICEDRETQVLSGDVKVCDNKWTNSESSQSVGFTNS